MQRERLYDAKRYQLKILIIKPKGTTCKHLWKLILPLQISPCGIMDLSLAFWSYKFSPLHRLIHNLLSSLSWTITTCKLLWSGLLLVLQILSLWNQTSKRKALVAQGRVKLGDPLYVEWIRSPILTLTLHGLSSP